MHTYSPRTRPSLSRYLLLPTFIAVIFLLIPAIADAQPYTPESDSTVIETLPTAIINLSQRLRAADNQTFEPTNPNLLLQQALTSYQIAVAEQEPRAYGRTMAIIQSWPADIAKPALLHVIAAAVLQHNHQFDDALVHLQDALTLEPANVQAWMIQAQIGLVTANYVLTQESCDALHGLARPSIHTNCQAQLDGVTGKAQTALTNLNAAMMSGQAVNQLDFLELQITAATISHRLGMTESADRYYRGALAISAGNLYTLVHYGDLLLQHGRPQDLVDLLAQRPDNIFSTELNILRAEALLATQTPAALTQAQAIITNLQNQFDTALLRDEAFPHKEYARYALRILDNPELALSSATQNWQIQKEPSDALLLAQAAAAANNLDSLAQLHQWAVSTSLEDVQLEAVFITKGLRQP